MSGHLLKNGARSHELTLEERRRGAATTNKLRDRLVRVERKGYRRPKPITFGEYADGWIEESKRRRNWRPRTILVNDGALRRLRPFFGRLPLAQIRTRDVTAYVSDALGEY